MTSHNGHKKVLVVDDTVDNLELLSLLLSRSGYHVLTAENGREGLEVARHNHPNIIISDVTMPQMDGIELTYRVRSDEDLSTIPVLLISALRKDSNSVIKGLRTGAFDYLESPYEPRELLAKIARLLEVNKAAEDLRESEEKYRMLMEQASDGIAVFDSQGTFLEVNSRACEILGYTCDELKQHNFREFIPEEDLIAHPLRLDGILAGRKLLTERNVRRKDGTLAPLEISTAMLSDGRIQAIARDITERKQLESEHARLASIVEASDDAIISKTLEGTITSWNRGAERTYGYSAKEAIGRPISIIIPTERSDELQHILNLIRRGENIKQFETIRRRKDGTLINVSVTASPIKNADGTVTECSVVARDITESKQMEAALRRSEERYREIVENARDIIYTHDLEGRFTSLNKAGEHITGYTLEEALTMNIDDVLAPEYKEQVHQVIEKKIFVGPPATCELEILSKDGRRVALEINSRPVFEGGEVIGVQGIARDVSERKHALEALRERDEQLRQSQKLEAVGKLAGGIAHDFNNLLTVITGYSELLLRTATKDSPEQRKLREIRKAAECASSLTRQLLAFSRKQVLQPKVIDLNVLVAQMGKMLRRMIGEDIELVTVMRPETGYINADPGQIEQVILNLLVNARDAMPHGGKVVIETTNVLLDQTYADARNVVVPGHYAMLAVSDNGVGMDEETQERIFEPFFTTKELGKGTGLGLSTVYGIVKQSGGYIWVYSEPGVGTTFKIYLPQVNQSGQQAQPAIEPLAPHKGEGTILLVEDEDMVRRLAKDILVKSGYEVLEASSGKEALSVSERHDGPIHLMVTDVVMPKMSGRELAERIKTSRPEMHVLYMSGYTDDAIVHHGVLDPGIAFLEKPFTPETLARKVQEAMATP